MECKTYHTKTGKPIRLWRGDCMDLMDGKPENHWDLAIVDPEYGLNMDNQTVRVKPDRPNTYKRAGEKQYKNTSYSDNKKVDGTILHQIYFNTKNQVIWGANYFCKDIPEGRGWIYWDKQMGDNNFSSGEFAFQSIYRKSASFSHPSMRVSGTRIHPNEKPVKLYRWLLQNYAEPGDNILDTHGGSMSLAIACYIEDHELDIIELDEDYYKAAVNRFEQHISQKTLF